MRVDTALLIAGIFVLASGAYAADTRISWGRADVPLSSYKSDAIACARLGADRDIGGEDATARVIAAERILDRDLNMPSAGGPNGSVGLLRRRYQPDRRIAELQSLLASETERCLVDRGYVPFGLTKEQGRQLGRLDRGSEARRVYLHSLASDARVLSSQAVVPATGDDGERRNAAAKAGKEDRR